MNCLLLFHLLVLALAMLWLFYRSPSSSSTVIIVGAGMSGISAAQKLSNEGITDFLILEATDRIGGRIRKTDFAGYTVEMGANWLHGVGGRLNPLFEMANQIDLNLFFSDFSNVSLNTYKQEGGLYTKDEVEAAFKKTEEVEEYGAEVAEILNEEEDKDDDMSILDLERLNKMTPRTKLEKMIDYFTFDGEQAEAPRVTSLKHVIPYAESTDFGEDAFFVADSRGFESLVHLIAKQFLSYNNLGAINDPRVKFNQVVTEVDQSQDRVIVRTEDGKVYQSKLVMLSPSLGVLQSDLISFKPQLPFRKIRAISEFSIGIYTKIFLKFPHSFWPTGRDTEFFFYVHERRGYYAIWQHLENEYPGSNILFVTVTDEESIRIEQQSDDETKEEAMDVLRKMFGNEIPEAIHIMIPRWYSDRFYKGCFTNWPVGYPQHRHDDLRAPIGKVYFTGEHTHPRYFGYADGAYFAGAETAKDVIDCLKNSICRGDNIN